MKKIAIVLSLIITLVVTTSFTKINAQEPDIEWNSVNVFSGNYALIGELEYDVNVKHITFQLPESGFHRNNVAGLVAEIAFYADPTDVTPIATLNFEDFFGVTFDVFVDIDLECLGITGSTYMVMTIPQSYGVTPVGYVSYIDDNDNLQLWYDTPSHRQSYFVYDSTNEFIYSKRHEIDLETVYLNLLLPNIDYYVSHRDEESYIEFRDIDGILLDTILLEDFLEINKEQYRIKLQDGATYTIDDIFYFQIFLHVDPVTSFNFIDNANRNFIYFFNDDGIVVRFYAVGSVWDSTITIVGDIPNMPIDPPDNVPLNLYFDYWVDANGRKYEETAITEDMVQGGYVSFYAFYKSNPVLDLGDLYIPDDVTPPSNAIASGLAHLGFNDPTSRTIVFSFVILALTGFMIYLKVSYFSIILVDALVSFFFMYLGLVPTFVSVIIIIVFLYLGWSFLSSGGVSRE